MRSKNGDFLYGNTCSWRSLIYLQLESNLFHKPVRNN